VYRLRGEGLLIVPVELEAEDIGSLIVFIEQFLPMVDTQDPDSRNVAETVYKVQETLRQSVGLEPGVNPL
jgi:hypothetical protein